MGLGRKIALGLIGIFFLYAFFTAEEVPPQPEGVCDTDEYGCVEIPKGEPILIGTYLDHSGPKSDIGDDSLNGVLLAADYIDGSFDGENARFLGRGIAFSHKDDECNVESKHATRELLSESFDRGLIAVIGGTCDAGTLGVSDQILSNEGILMISPSATHPWLTDPGTHAEFFFRTAHNGSLETEALAEFAVEQLGAHTVAHASVNYADPSDEPFARAFLRHGGRDAIPIDLDPESPDPTSIAGQLRDIAARRGTHAVYLASEPRYQLPVVRATRSLFLRNMPLLVEEHRLPKPKVPNATHTQQELYVASPENDLSGRFYEEEFLPAYRARFGEPSSRYHAHSFDAAMLILQAIEQVAIIDKTDDGDVLFIPRTALRDQIAATRNYEGVSGTLTCDDSGDCNLDAPMLVRKFQNGSHTVVWRSDGS